MNHLAKYSVIVMGYSFNNKRRYWLYLCLTVLCTTRK